MNELGLRCLLEGILLVDMSSVREGTEVEYYSDICAAIDSMRKDTGVSVQTGVLFRSGDSKRYYLAKIYVDLMPRDIMGYQALEKELLVRGIVVRADRDLDISLNQEYHAA